MAITYFASPKTLSWSDFTTVSTKPKDPHDGSDVDALTEYEYFLPKRPFKKDGSDFVLDDSLILLITPKCKVWTGVSQTGKLLAHEQFHYDVGVIIARAAVSHLNRLRASTENKLKSLLRKAAHLHFVTRNKLIQKRYDVDTHHGTNAHYQSIWKNRMAKCLSNANATQIGGFFL